MQFCVTLFLFLFPSDDIEGVFFANDERRSGIGSLSVKRPSLRVDDAKRTTAIEEGRATKNSPFKDDHNSTTNLYHIIRVH